jgi:hypothetical protein
MAITGRTLRNTSITPPSSFMYSYNFTFLLLYCQHHHHHHRHRRWWWKEKIAGKVLSGGTGIGTNVLGIKSQK